MMRKKRQYDNVTISGSNGQCLKKLAAGFGSKLTVDDKGKIELKRPFGIGDQTIWASQDDRIVGKPFGCRSLILLWLMVFGSSGLCILIFS